MTTMQPRSRAEAKMLGLPDWQIDQMFPATGMDIEAQHDFNAPQMPQGGLLSAPEPQPGFWQGGDKFRARDGLAGLLAVVGDALSRNSGGEAFATQGLLGGRLDAQELARKKAEEQAQLAEMMAVGQQLNLSPAQIRAQQLGLKVPEPEKPDAFTQTLINAGIDPKSPEGIALYRQRASTQANPAPSLIGSPETGYRWVQPPSPASVGSGRRELTPEEIERLGLPKGGPGGNRPGGFPRRY